MLNQTTLQDLLFIYSSLPTLISLKVDPLREFKGAHGRARSKARRTRGPENSYRGPPWPFSVSLVLMAFLLAFPLAPWISLKGSSFQEVSGKCWLISFGFRLAFQPGWLVLRAVTFVENNR